MVYCYECGEKVAENDVFCPFCGISLSPSAAVEEDEPGEISFAQPSQLPTASELYSEPTKNAAESAASFDKNTVENANSRTGDFSTDVTAENVGLLPASFETPQSAEPEINYSPRFGQPANVPVNPVPIAIEPIEPLEETPNDSSIKSPLMSDEEAEIKKVFSPETSVDKSVSEVEATASLADFDVDDYGAKNALPAADYDEDYEMERAFAELASPAAIEEKSEIPTAAEKLFAIPSEVLPLEDPFPPSRFDSVSIMEKSAPVEEKPAAENLPPPSETPIIFKTPVSTIGESSFTQPNIGNSDTGGKNNQKLKPLDEGTVLNGRYEIVRKIGGGGMGAVYLASDKNLGGVLRAVKEMVQSYIEDAQQDKAVSDFKRESLLLTSLDHQSIPTIYDYFFDEKEARFYLVMKYISGGDLSSRLRSAPTGRIEEAEVSKWSAQITDVLDYLHNRQPPIVYRDLKPANIMVDGNSGRTMLIDFGIARWVNKEEKGVTAVGTMGYAPPELFSGNVEARSDIYSLGSTMFHLLTGADPQSNPLLIFDFQKHPRPRQINPQISDQMERILMRAVEYSADKRFASAAEMRQQLEEHLENLKKGNVTFGVKEAPVSVALSDQPVFCGFCGQKIVATDMFCAFCGAKQPLAQQGVHSHSEGYAPAPLTAQLLVIGTNELEQPSFRLEKEDNLVGRRDPQSNIFPEVDLSKYDPQTKISRRHARIWREGSEFMVEDLGSSNGTYLLPVISDTVRLQPRQPQLLTNGDKIRLGDTTLHFILG
ncbi:MAG: protein kinase [Pyrinomonadaceae bacterium]|nr:protein kinase [Pyrinomonadaceae bacterium]